MRISDWSSDVCSSDLWVEQIGGAAALVERVQAVDQQPAHGIAGFARGAADVRGQKHVVELAIARVDMGFVGVDVQARGKQAAAGERVDQRVVDHQDRKSTRLNSSP